MKDINQFELSLLNQRVVGNTHLPWFSRIQVWDIKVPLNPLNSHIWDEHGMGQPLRGRKTNTSGGVYLTLLFGSAIYPMSSAKQQCPRSCMEIHTTKVKMGNQIYLT